MRRRLTGNTAPFLAFGTIAVTSFILHQCDGDRKPVENALYTSVDECVASGRDQRLCLLSYQDAMRAHTANAPHFQDTASCEAEYGNGQCTEQQLASSTIAPAVVGGLIGATAAGSRFFSPKLAAYSFPGNIRDVNEYSSYRQSLARDGRAYGSTPIYRNRSGQLMTRKDDDDRSSSSHSGGGGGGSGFHAADGHGSGRGGFGGGHASGAGG